MKLIYISAIVLAALLIACQPPVQQTVVNNPTPTGNVVKETTTTTIPEGKGRVVFTLSSTGTYPGVSAMRMTVDSVEVFSANDGWVTINGDENTYDLLQLQGEHGLLGDKVIDSDTYTQVRMKISSVQVVDQSGEHNVVLPMENLIINAELPLKQGSLSTVTFDFLIDQGLRLTQSGQYVMLPVVHLVTRQDAAVDLRPANRVVITAGTIMSDLIFGTNVRGETSVDIRVPTETVIVVQNDRIVEQGTTTQNNVVVNNTTVNNTVVNNVVVNNQTVNNTVVQNTTTTNTVSGNAPWWQRNRTATTTSSGSNSSTNSSVNVTNATA